MMITVLYKKLNPDAVAPTRAHEGDAGWDITAVSAVWDDKYSVWIYDSALAFAPPAGVWLLLASRSSVYKHGLWLAGGVGIIDNGFRNSVKAIFYSITGTAIPYTVGERFAQLIPMGISDAAVDFVEVEDLPAAVDSRNTGGFGSTGG